MPLKQQIISEIASAGDMPLDRYMEICNSHYYATRDPFGEKGDFITAPEISQIFGEIIGVWLITKWEAIGKPQKIALVELGPGRGTLMADILRIVKKYFTPEVHLVETSPVLQKAQKHTLSSSDLIRGSSLDSHVKHENDIIVKWHDSLPKLDVPTIIIANEFFDALPFKQAVDGMERKITSDGKNLSFNIPAEDGITDEFSPIGDEIARQISQTAAGGIIIDYGYTANNRNSTLQAVKNHKYHNILENPGDADLTALVDFPRIQGILTKYSGKPCTITTQREFLLAHGADVRAKILNKENDLARLVDSKQMGDLFKVLCF